MVGAHNPFEATVQANVEAVRRSRPRLLTQLARPSGPHRYELASGPSGETTLARVDEQGSAVPCVPGGAPTAHLLRVRDQLPRDLLSPVGLAGVGDGSVLSLLARIPPPAAAVGAVQPVIVVEPDSALLAACLHLHDFAGPTGPFADPRFHFCVGEGWEREFERIVIDEALVPCPQSLILGGTQRPDIGAGAQRVAKRLGATLAELREQVSALYAGRSDRESAALLSRVPPRRPRALVITSRFTTVLQYTAAHLAQAFRQLGFDADVLIEPANHCRLTSLVLLRKLAALAPDLVVFPDHLRSEFPGIFPERLPYVCWAQDELSWLANAEAGRGVRKRDFVWVRDVDTYRDSYEYPQGQLVEATSWTVERPLEPRSAKPDHDLIYFSHSSWDSERIVSEPVLWGRVHGIDEGVLRTLSSELLRRYQRDEAVNDLYRFCGEVAPELGFVPPSRRTWNGQRVVREARPAAPQQLAVRALAQARSILHRQQGLRWAARCAGQLGWSLSIFGRDWDKLPEFAAHARGVANYDTELVPLSRSSRINLALEPWAVVSHWRGLDALSAGALLLARHEPYREPAFAWLARLLSEQPRLPRSVGQALAAAGAEREQELLEAVERIMLLPFVGMDPVAYVTEQLEGGVDPSELMSLPGLQRFCFDTEAELLARASWVKDEPDESHALCLSLRQQALSRYSYRAGAQLLCDELSHRLGATEAAA